MKKFCCALLCGLCGQSGHAALYERGQGLIYDDVLDITWLQDANFAYTTGYVTPAGRPVAGSLGQMTWGEALEWAESLKYAGASEWRLPGVKPVNNRDFQIQVSFDGSTDFGEYIVSPNSELSYMYYVNLQNIGIHDQRGQLLLCGVTGACLKNSGPFINLQADNYWSGTEVITQPAFAWSFNAQHGIQTPYDGKPNQFFAWAVHDGDVGRPEVKFVPLPAATVWLLGGAFIFVYHFMYMKWSRARKA